MASSTRDRDPDDVGQEIKLVHSEECWVATDLETGVASQGETRSAALENLDEALALHRGDDDSIETADEERAALQEMGIGPEEVDAAREDSDELPEFMQ